MKKNVLRTSFRSEIQATDSTCSGCSPNSAATSPLRHTAPVIRRKDDEQQQRVGHMQGQVHEMVTARRLVGRPKELAGQHVRKHGQRMPVAHRHASKGVGDALRGEAIANERVFAYVAGIVQQDERIRVDRQVDERHRRRPKGNQ